MEASFTQVLTALQEAFLGRDVTVVVLPPNDGHAITSLVGRLFRAHDHEPRRLASGQGFDGLFFEVGDSGSGFALSPASLIDAVWNDEKTFMTIRTTAARLEIEHDDLGAALWA